MCVCACRLRTVIHPRSSNLRHSANYNFKQNTVPSGAVRLNFYAERKSTFVGALKVRQRGAFDSALQAAAREFYESLFAPLSLSLSLFTIIMYYRSVSISVCVRARARGDEVLRGYELAPKKTNFRYILARKVREKFMGDVSCIFKPGFSFRRKNSMQIGDRSTACFSAISYSNPFSYISSRKSIPRSVLQKQRRERERESLSLRKKKVLCRPN